MNNELMEMFNETTLLGLKITSDLSWKKNTEHCVSKANTRMQIIRSLIKFSVPIDDLVLLYCQFVRTILEFNSNVWFSAITKDEEDDLERIQKTACKLILNRNYHSYEDAINKLNIEKLSNRRQKLALKFAKGCVQLKQMKELFEESNQNFHDTR